MTDGLDKPFKSAASYRGYPSGLEFQPVQKALLGNLLETLTGRGLACTLSYSEQSGRSLATLTLRNGQGGPALLLQLQETRSCSSHAPNHYFYSYDLYAGTPAQGLNRIAFSQLHGERTVPRRLLDAARNEAFEAARAEGLFPKVVAIPFGKNRN